MRRICMSALTSIVMAGAMSAQASAQVIYSPYAANGAIYMTQQPAQATYPAQQQAYPAQQQYVYVQQGAPAQAPAPAARQQQYYVYAPQQPYPAAAPAYTGTIAPRYVAAAPQSAPAPAYAPPAPAAPPVTVAASSPGGGGFLEAIFGGPTIDVRRDYQPGLPQYQQQPPQQPAAIAPQNAYAPSSQGDMSAAAYPVDPKFNRQVVDYRGEQKPGTIIIDTPNKFLYLVEGGGRALRYGIGVGRPGFTWSGEKEITAMREWPDWRPPADMLARRPDLPRYMPGGVDNPLGARAMYLGSTLYRIHGSNEPWTIGTNVSSGCIRMRNEDVTDLYGRVKVGTKVMVM
jgi:lipoprotein-anchoring transpeptidase ErfK/SrfK